MTPKEQAEATAARLTNDAGFKEILKAMKNVRIQDWANAQTVEAREKAWHALHAIGDLEASIRGLVQGAELDARKLARQGT